jgi:sucrose phosphorylase
VFSYDLYGRMSTEQDILDHLTFLYGQELGPSAAKRLMSLLEEFRKRNPQLASVTTPSLLTERDAFLITYGDQITEADRPPLQTLARFLNGHLAGAMSGVHLLPFFPFSSDDGFSVTDFWKVDPRLGTWNDVASLGKGFRLVFDAVINHVSRRSAWFQGFIRGEEPYADYFICVDPYSDLARVTRPRTSPLLTPVETARGVKHVWTTFSDDQIDLNYKNPEVLLKIIELLLFYAEQGAEIIRLDAIAYLWKEPGTTCIHLPQTHRIVKLFRSVFDEVAPAVMLLTETNVPHADNVSYFGNGRDEAQMVYNFALPPLVFHTFLSGNAQRLTDWAAALTAPSRPTAFFNFIASHDGIGVMPARGLLSESEIHESVKRTLAHGGKVSSKSNPDGSESPYELNTTLFDALNDPQAPDPILDVRRFLASQVIMLSLAGVPGIYVHSLFGSRNCHACVAETSRSRSINREKFQSTALEAELADPNSLKHRVLAGMKRLLKIRREQVEFHPNAEQRVLSAGKGIFALVRGRQLLVVVNVTPKPQELELKLREAGLPPSERWLDLIGERNCDASGDQLRLHIEPHQSLWLKPSG